MHRQVVELIKKGRDTLRLTIISVPPRGAQRLDPDDEFFFDYTDLRSIDLSVPTYMHVEEEGNKYVVSSRLFCISSWRWRSSVRFPTRLIRTRSATAATLLHCPCRRLSAKMDPITRYTIRRNTASIKKKYLV